MKTKEYHFKVKYEDQCKRVGFQSTISLDTMKKQISKMFDIKFELQTYNLYYTDIDHDRISITEPKEFQEALYQCSKLGDNLTFEIQKKEKEVNKGEKEEKEDSEEDDVEEKEGKDGKVSPLHTEMDAALKKFLEKSKTIDFNHKDNKNLLDQELTQLSICRNKNHPNGVTKEMINRIKLGVNLAPASIKKKMSELYNLYTQEALNKIKDELRSLILKSTRESIKTKFNLLKDEERQDLMEGFLKLDRLNQEEVFEMARTMKLKQIIFEDVDVLLVKLCNEVLQIVETNNKKKRSKKKDAKLELTLCLKDVSSFWPMPEKIQDRLLSLYMTKTFAEKKEDPKETPSSLEVIEVVNNKQAPKSQPITPPPKRRTEDISPQSPSILQSFNPSQVRTLQVEDLTGTTPTLTKKPIIPVQTPKTPTKIPVRENIDNSGPKTPTRNSSQSIQQIENHKTPTKNPISIQVGPRTPNPSSQPIPSIQQNIPTQSPVKVMLDTYRGRSKRKLPIEFDQTQINSQERVQKKKQ